MVGGFEQQALDLLVSRAGAIGNMQSHPGYPVLLSMIGEIEQGTLEQMGECKPDELGRLQGKRDALRVIRRVLSDLPQVAEDVLIEKVEEGEIDNEELVRLTMR